MSLNTLLSAMSQEFAAKADPAALTIMQNSLQQLEDSGLHKEVLGPGEQMSDFVLLDSSNSQFSSREARKTGPLLLCWYRGIW